MSKDAILSVPKRGTAPQLKQGTPMAEATTATTAAPKATRRKPQGPRNVKPYFVMYKGDNIEIVSVTQDAGEALDIMDGDRDVKRVKITPVTKAGRTPATVPPAA